MVLCLFFGFSGFAVNQAWSASAGHNALIPLKNTPRTLYFWKKIRTTWITAHYPIRGSYPSNFCWMGWSAARWRWVSIFLTSSWTRRCSASFFNCMRQSWYSEINFVLLHQSGSPRSCLIFFNTCRCQHTTLCGFWIHKLVSPYLLSLWHPRDQTEYVSRFPLWTLAHIRVSPYLIIVFWVLVGFVVIFAASSNFRIQITHPLIFVGNFRWWSRWHIYLMENDFIRFYHNYFRDTISWECIIEDDCDWSCLIEL